MLGEHPSSVKSSDLQISPNPDTDMVERALPTPLQEAIQLTCNIIGDVLEREAAPPAGIALQIPESPKLDFERSDEGVTRAIFRLSRIRDDGKGRNPPQTTLELGLVHDHENPHSVQLDTIARIEQTEIYTHGEFAYEVSRMVIASPVHIPGEEDAPVFDMRILKLSDDARSDFRRALAHDVNEAYSYIVKDETFIESKRKNRMQGIPRKTPAAA